MPDYPNLPGHPLHPFTDPVVYHMQHTPIAPLFDERFVPSLGPFHNVDFMRSDDCPRNFVIFDQTHNRSQIMFHPEINSQLFHPEFGVSASIFQKNFCLKDTNDARSSTSPQKEDSDDIDALLSMDEEECDDEDDDDDDDVVSTARTNAIYCCNSPDSCSNYESHPKKTRPHFQKSSGSNCHEKKRHRTRMMVNALREIIPGANQMSTVDVLNEAVRYLKSLRVEIQKTGTRKFQKLNLKTIFANT